MKNPPTLGSINANLRLLKVLIFVVDVEVVDVVTNVVDVALLVVTSHIIFSSINVNPRLLKDTIEFLWWGGLHSHFYVQPNFSVEVVLSYG